MRRHIKRLLGANRPKVIAVLASTHEEAASCVEHAKTSGSSLPVWVWCAEPGVGARPCGDRLWTSATALSARRDLQGVWPALTIVCWTGERSATGLKLLPFTVPPFRIVIRNEAADFFPAASAPLVEHLIRRIKDTAASCATRLGEWLGAVFGLCWSLVWHAADWAWSAILAALAQVAPVFWPLALRASRRRRASRYLAIARPKRVNSSAVDMAVADRRWRKSRIERTATDSDASFVVFRHPDCFLSAQPLLDLAIQTGAFAVAQQSAYTGWRRQVTSRHPFRPLQPGEVSLVLSPISPLLVVNREALLTLGIPRAFTFGAGIALLGYRAAAAGLQSFTIGGSQPVTQEPAMALEDLELVLRLGDLAPQYPELRRGTIGQSPALASRFTGKPRILVVSPYLPFPLSHGGAVRIFNLCRELSVEVDFVLACFREEDEYVHYDELYKVFREVYVVDIDEQESDSSVPPQVSEYRSSAMRTLIQNLCEDRAIELVQLEYTQMAEYRNCTGDTPVLLVEHDITLSLYRQLAELSGTDSALRQSGLWQRFERDALADVSAVWTMSRDDRALALEYGADEDNTLVVPNGVDLNRFQPSQKTGTAPTLLFVGSFRHLPNLLAFEALRDTILPEVRKRVPRVQLHVVAGPDHERAARSAGRAALLDPVPGIRMEGFVQDLQPAYRECDVVVIPLPVSAGTNIKLMEAMACGRAVVSTPVGCHGLGLRDGDELVIRDLAEGFAAAIADLLEDRENRSRLAANARRTAEKHFGWHNIAGHAHASYAQLLGITCREPIH
ncbi:MAG: hypothetical protein JWN34_419 [Bryobacterales bacterium]|nr:hypothetical protein [Bryobacterales bacterium]